MKLINATNLHVGGGVQVAVSFLHELIKSSKRNDCIEIIVSSEVDSTFRKSFNFDLYKLKRDVLDVKGLNVFDVNCKSYFSQYDCVFTIFGPLYKIGGGL